MIEAIALTKSYGPRLALNNVSFTIERGEIVGFLGPNGAGKTTTMRILTGFLPATGGDARVAGFDVFESPMEVKRRVGYLPESPPLYPELSVGDYLGFIAELRGFTGRARHQRTGSVMERVGLSGWERRILGSLSKGYRQRVGLAQALLHDPPVLILDEPTSGLDPAQLVGIRDLVKSLAGTHTVILSTHILSEVEALCPRALVITKGQLVAQGSLDELRAMAPRGDWYLVEVDGLDGPRLGALPQVDLVEPLGADGAWRTFRLNARVDPRPAVAELAREAGARVRTLEHRLPTLEEAFVSIVGRE
jgi:ABC-2 type transport system ATP-binding protein